MLCSMFNAVVILRKLLNVRYSIYDIPFLSRIVAIAYVLNLEYGIAVVVLYVCLTFNCDGVMSCLG